MVSQLWGICAGGAELANLVSCHKPKLTIKTAVIDRRYSFWLPAVVVAALCERRASLDARGHYFVATILLRDDK